MQDWMRELGGWEEKMNQKDEALKTVTAINRAVPPVRNKEPDDAGEREREREREKNSVPACVRVCVDTKASV